MYLLRILIPALLTCYFATKLFISNNPMALTTIDELSTSSFKRYNTFTSNTVFQTIDSGEKSAELKYQNYLLGLESYAS